MLANTEHLRKYGYRLDRFDRAYIRKLQEVIPVVNGWVLDVGCGEGSTVAELTLNRKIVGLDIAPATVKIAKSKHVSMDFVVADALHMQFRACLKLVVANQLIEHVPSARSFLQEVIRVLIKGGYVAISTPNRHRISNIPRLLFDRLRGRASYPYKLGCQLHLREYTLPEIRHLLSLNSAIIASFQHILGFYGSYCLPIGRPRFLCYMIFALVRKDRDDNSG